jgi:protein gp37
MQLESVIEATIDWMAPEFLETRSPFSDLFEIHWRELDAITESMHERGYDASKPIDVWQKGVKLIVVDGHTRLKAAIECGLAVAVFRHEFPDEDAALRYAIANQRNRRNLTDIELMRAAELIDKPKPSGFRSDLLPSGKRSDHSHSQTASILGVGTTTVSRIRAVLSDPEAKAAVQNGEQSINGAYTDVVTKRRFEKTEGKSLKQSNLPVLPPVATRGLFIPSAADIDTLRAKSGAAFNEQKNDNIEWARWSWNPVTGCLHGCNFCYAREIALKIYDQKFEPTFLPERLAAPRNTKVPDKAGEDIGWANVFVCSMADLWGKWVPSEIIRLVLRECAEQSQWNYLFLTKFPNRYEEFAQEFPSNTWVGTTVTCQDDVPRAVKAFEKLVDAGHKGVRWLSIEPLLGPVQFNVLQLGKLSHWMVIGGQSDTRQPDGYVPAFYPPLRWALDLVKQADAAQVKVYMKTNLLHNSSRIREYPQ